ncbi:MAG: hypothetical protein IPL98_19505 [Saprospiraceae bacterium]|nr:hypothetical protein [Saprospiraceae bacterium]
MILGDIKTANKLEDTKPVNLEIKQVQSRMKEAKGSPYAFLNLDASTNYVVKPSRTDEPLNGVTTADIVKIQKHILGQEAITNPHLLIAGSEATGTITAADM